MSAMAMLSLTSCFRLFLRIRTESVGMEDELELETDVMEAVSAIEAYPLSSATGDGDSQSS